jgi:hypothetical protein
MDCPRCGSDQTDVSKRGCLENQFPGERQRLQLANRPDVPVRNGFQLFDMRESQDSPNHFRSCETKRVLEEMRDEPLTLRFDGAEFRGRFE